MWCKEDMQPGKHIARKTPLGLGTKPGSLAGCMSQPPSESVLGQTELCAHLPSFVDAKLLLQGINLCISCQNKGSYTVRDFLYFPQKQRVSAVATDCILDIMSHWSDPEQKLLCTKNDVFMYDFIIIPLARPADPAFVLTVPVEVCVQPGLF